MHRSYTTIFQCKRGVNHEEKRFVSKNIRIWSVMTVGVGMLLFTCTSAAMAKDNVIIYHAVNLSVPFEKMEKIFESENSNIDIIRTSGGSAKMARLISEQNKHSDIMASADFTVIDKYLIPVEASWNIRFATK